MNTWFSPGSVWFSPDARMVLLEDIGGYSHPQHIQCWDLRGPLPRMQLQGLAESFTPDGSRAAIAEWDETQAAIAEWQAASQPRCRAATAWWMSSTLLHRWPGCTSSRPRSTRRQSPRTDGLWPCRRTGVTRSSQVRSPPS